MTVTGSSMAWVDFRRKLSKWLSTNGMNIAQVKNVITFVQRNVDPQSTGSVRKETFLKFADDLMGVDCLLSPGSFLSLAAEEPVRPPQPFTRSPTPENVPIRLPPPKNLAVRTPVPGTIVPRSPHVVASKPGSQSESSNLLAIRRKLAVGSLQKLVVSRMRILFALFRISPAEKPRPVVEQRPAARVPDRSAAVAILMAVQLVRRRLLTQAYVALRYVSTEPEPENEQETTVVQSVPDESGPSWTVTIQAVAVSNLFGILRTSLCRAAMPAFFSIKSGHSVDVYNPLKKVLWAQSSQGKRDALAAAGKQPRGALAPINENMPSSSQVKENVPVKGIEFDLSV